MVKVVTKPGLGGAAVVVSKVVNVNVLSEVTKNEIGASCNV